MFLSSWGRFERRFANILDDMKRHEALIDQESNARNIAEAKVMRQEIRTWKEESLERISLQEIEQSSREFQSIVSWLRMDESDQLSIFESISAQGNKYAGTCSWTLQNAKIRSWLQPKPETPILFLHGTPGTGKSVISTQLINFMKAPGKFVIYHFCTYSSVSSTEYDQILKHVLLQILRHDGDLIAHLYSEYVLKKKSPTRLAMEQLLQTLLASISSDPNKKETVWIILDGLDECRADSPSVQDRIITLVNHVTTKVSISGSAICKVLVSVRTSSVPTRILRRYPAISLTEEKGLMAQAIQEYISQRMGLLHTIFEQLGMDQTEVKELGRVISHKADGKTENSNLDKDRRLLMIIINLINV